MKKADIVIVGAGAAGATLAAELADAVQVIVLEAEDRVGYHASGRSAAVFVPSYGHGLLRRLTSMSRDFYNDLDPEFFPSPLLSRRGLLRVVLRGGDAQHQAATGDMPGIRPVSPIEAVEHFPLLDSKKILNASYESDVHDIDTEALMQGCLRKARSLGVEVVLGNPVTALERTPRGWLVTTKSGTIRCAWIVNAAGAWANQVAGLAGIRPVPFQVCRRSIAVLPLPQVLEGHPTVPFTVTMPLRWYAKAEPASLLISPADEDPVMAPHDAFADDMTLAEGLHRFSEDSGFEIKRVTRSWAGLRSLAPDEYPVIGIDPEADGFFWLAGQAGFGIQCAPGLARLAAGLMKGRVPDEELTEAFDISRLRRF